MEIMARKNAEIMHKKSKSFGKGSVKRDSIRSSIGGSVKSKINSNQQTKSRMPDSGPYNYESSVSQNHGTSTQKEMDTPLNETPIQEPTISLKISERDISVDLDRVVKIS